MKCTNLDDFKDKCPNFDCRDRGKDMFLRKVVIPSVLGDENEGEYALENGLYKNAVVEYQASGAVYLFSSDGIPTKIGYSR